MFSELVGCVGQYVSGRYVAVFGGVCVVRRDSIRRSVSVASDNVKLGFNLRRYDRDEMCFGGVKVGREMFFPYMFLGSAHGTVPF